MKLPMDWAPSRQVCKLDQPGIEIIDPVVRLRKINTHMAGLSKLVQSMIDYYCHARDPIEMDDVTERLWLNNKRRRAGESGQGYAAVSRFDR